MGVCAGQDTGLVPWGSGAQELLFATFVGEEGV